MDSRADVFARRARTEIDAAILLFESSGKEEVLSPLGIDEKSTFFSGSIAHAYYSIFYLAKAMLLTKNIDTKPPEIHKKTFDAFKTTFIDSGILDVELLMIYKEMIIRADTLLEIYREEKGKRGRFTYNIIPQANREPASRSIEHAKMFFKHCSSYLGS